MYEENTLVCTIGFTVVLVFWRVWKFHLRPSLHPEDPKELPYWVPCEFQLSFYHRSSLSD